METHVPSNSIYSTCIPNTKTVNHIGKVANMTTEQPTLMLICFAAAAAVACSSFDSFPFHLFRLCSMRSINYTASRLTFVRTQPTASWQQTLEDFRGCCCLLFLSERCKLFSRAKTHVITNYRPSRVHFHGLAAQKVLEIANKQPL